MMLYGKFRAFCSSFLRKAIQFMFVFGNGQHCQCRRENIFSFQSNTVDTAKMAVLPIKFTKIKLLPNILAIEISTIVTSLNHMKNNKQPYSRKWIFKKTKKEKYLPFSDVLCHSTYSMTVVGSKCN